MGDWNLGGITLVVGFLALLGLIQYVNWKRARQAPEVENPPESARERQPPDMQQLLRAAAAGYEDGSLLPPRDVHDRAAWDRYWKAQLGVGCFEQGFNDMMSSDPHLVGLLRGRGARTILCVGNGMSSEASSLALHGFDVVALDISAIPEDLRLANLRDPGHPARRIPGFALSDDGVVTFCGSDPIAPELCPPIHRSAEHPNRGGGSLASVTGDLMDPEACPGPFDVVIERRTVQLFPEPERAAALERLVTRLADHGTFVSHEHRGCWRPGDSRTHFAESWLAERGFDLNAWGAESTAAEGRLARLMFSSG